MCRRRQHCYLDLKLQNLAEDNNGMDSVRLFITQSILEVLGKQIRFFMCHVIDSHHPFFTQKICAEGMLKIPCLALVVSLLGFL